MNQPPNNPFSFHDDTDDESSYMPSTLDDYHNNSDSRGQVPHLEHDVQEHNALDDAEEDEDLYSSHPTDSQVRSNTPLARLEPPQNARISTSPKRRPVSHMRDSSYSGIVDPFNTAFDDEDDDDAINHNHFHNDASSTDFIDMDRTRHNDSNSLYNINPEGKLNDNVMTYTYQHSTDSNIYNPENSTSSAAYPTSQVPMGDYEYYSPSGSYQNLAYTYHQNPNANVFNGHTSQGYEMDQFYSSAPIFQDFERDIDEPELNQQDLFRDEDFNDRNNIMDDTNLNIADKGDNKVELIDGKYYSFDYPVPNQLLDKIPFNGAKQLTEFTHLRYHAITADPKDYSSENPSAVDYIVNYPLRPKVYPIKRETELMIVCTMYNEDEVLLGRTLKGVFKNIKTMYNLNENSKHPFGRNSWKKIVVVIVSDGKAKINEKSKALLTLLGCFQEGIMQEYVNDDKVNAHLFEYTTTFGIGKFDYNRENDSYKVPLVSEQTVPIQLMFLLKDENKQKINSHRWALNFLCPNLNPKVIVLLDVGTEPGPDSIYKLWKAFKDPKIGGACGEIRAMLGNHASPNDESSIWKKIGRFIYFNLSDFATCVINPLVAAQNFEYKMSNILDKPMESAFGFVTVLPGAFSAYRYEALKGAPLAAYFHGEDMKSNTKKPAGILESNMYLAEDRILCFELVAKAEKPYLLKYVYNSYAVTDVPSQINEFINQRRRWLNGSFFAALYAVLHSHRILISKHSLPRKIALVLEIIYQTVNILLSWLALSMYFLVFRILTLDVVDTFVGERIGDILSIVFLWVYIGAIVLTFIISFGNKPNDAKYMYLLAFVLFSTIVIYMTFCVVCLTIESVHSIKNEIGAYSTFTASVGLKFLKNQKFRDLTLSLASTYLLYIIGSLLFLDMFHLFACTVQYILLSPAYINVLSIFAFCNINDISWGTKGALTAEVHVPKKKANKDEAANTDEKKVLVLSENMENPDILFQSAQNFLNGKKDPNDEKTEAELELEQIKENVRKSEKNYALGRTYTVIIWLISNFILLVVILRTGGLEDYSDYANGTTTNTNQGTGTSTFRFLAKRNYWNNMNVANYFMTTILWIVAALACFRLFGCIYYRISFFVNERRFNKSVVY